MGRVAHIFWGVCLACGMSVLPVGGTDVSFLMVYRPDHPEDPTTRQILDFTAAHPTIRPLQWGGLTLPGGGGRAQFTLALAGGTAPDIYKAWFHVLRHDVAEGFCYPLDEWVGSDTDGDGVLSIDEIRWPSWTNAPALWRNVATVEGRVYALAQSGVAHYGIVYRKDLVRDAGLDPENPPATWHDFSVWCKRLTHASRSVPGARVQRGQRAFAIENRPWGFLPWVNSAGGDVVGKAPDGTWRATFDSPAALRAAEFLKSLVTNGVVRVIPQLSLSSETAEMFAQGEIVSVFGGEDFVLSLTERLNFPAELVGIMPFPAADESCKRVLQAHRHFFAMTEGVGRRPKAERDCVWACLEALASPAVYDETIRRNVAEGRARWCDPKDLKRLGLQSYLGEVPVGIRKMYADLEAGRIQAVTEPYVGFWQGASELVSRRFLSMLLSDAASSFDCREALEGITAEANAGLMFEADTHAVEVARPYARVILGVVLIALLISGVFIWRARCERMRVEKPLNAGMEDRPPFRLAPWLFLAPALLSIALWSYWPLLRGAVMAFQDYRIVGASAWTGLDNFIRVACEPSFWMGWLRTLEYVTITLLLGFVSPVVLAVLLTEIPRGRIFFRTLYFLPHLTSALVVTLLWKLMFDPTENGMLNQLLACVGIAPQAWLQSPRWAMVCCILPGVWAGAGIASLIYVAALGSLPQDYYEAAAIDGAGILMRFRHVVFPQLLPLMTINFVGSFIAAFQGMGSIFLLTFGGPGDATNVLSLAIWKEAYNNLRFSTATTMAWYLGTALVCFTILQIRFLRRVEFRQASAN